MGPFLSMDELVAPGLEAIAPRERWESEADCLNLVIPGDGGSVDVPADKLGICSPEFLPNRYVTRSAGLDLVGAAGNRGAGSGW